MKKFFLLFLCIVFISVGLTGCKKKADLNPDNPVILSMWHVYGSQTKSPLNLSIDEFNRTVGREKGIIVNVVSVTSSSAIDKALVDAANGEPGAESLPDLFTAYPRVVELVGEERLLSWDEYFSEKELKTYNREFLDEGYFGEKLLMLPVAKSSEVFYLNKTLFDKFASATSQDIEKLKNFEGIFEISNLYFDYSGGKNFMQINDLYHYAFLGMKEYGSDFIIDGSLNLSDFSFEKVWNSLARCAIYGGICLDEGYAASRWKTAEVISNIGSTADVLYQPDKVIYGDNTTEKIEAVAMPYPSFVSGSGASVHRGGGLFAVKSDDERKNYAAYVFADWITEKENNLKFVTEAGYLPVKDEAYELFNDNPSCIEKYRSMYESVSYMMNNYRLYSLPLFSGASDVQHSFENNSRMVLKMAHNQYIQRIAAGEDKEKVLNELVEYTLSEIRKLSLK